MPWAVAAAAVAAGGAIYSANKQAGAAKKAANASQNATDAAIAQQNLNYDRTSTNLTPYVTAGNSALTQMQALNSGDFSSFKQSPDYQFAFDQGLQSLDRSAAARGSLYSGGHSADLMNFGQGLASQNYNNFYAKLQNLATQGQNSASNLGSIGAGQAGAIGGLLTGNATAQGNAAQNSANASGQMVNGLVGAFGQYAGSQYNPTASSYMQPSPYGYNNTTSGTLNGSQWGSDMASIGGGTSTFPYASWNA